jgi:gamma-glutamylcyclotransferase (GGCT)/AIG2-like uncharacterized protein YtfP
MDEVVKFPCRLFVYGTLKRRHGNNRLLEGSKFIRNATAFGVLLHLGGFPGFLPETTGMAVMGEIWEVPDKPTLDQIDQLEGHPHHYIRQKIFIGGGEEVYTYVYNQYFQAQSQGSPRAFHMVASGDWTGRQTTATIPFIGFLVGKTPPRTSVQQVCHVKFPGEFACMMDTLTGMPLPGNWRAEGKPHFQYDAQLNLWVPALKSAKPPITGSYTVTLPPEKKKEEDKWVPYIDPSDPGEILAPTKPAKVA